jgi:hypothetical protein
MSPANSVDVCPRAAPGSPQISSGEPIIPTGEPTEGASLRGGHIRPHIRAMHLDLTDDEAAALTQELHDIVESDRYPFSARIRTLRAILVKQRPEPPREPLPARKVYALPSFIGGRRHRR